MANQSASRPQPATGSIAVRVFDSISGAVLAGASVSVWKVTDTDVPAGPPPGTFLGIRHTGSDGCTQFDGLAHNSYLVVLHHLQFDHAIRDHYRDDVSGVQGSAPRSVMVRPGCVETACFELSLGLHGKISFERGDGRSVPTPRVGDSYTITVCFNDSERLWETGVDIEHPPGTHRVPNEPIYIGEITRPGPARTSFALFMPYQPVFAGAPAQNGPSRGRDTPAPSIERRPAGGTPTASTGDFGGARAIASVDFDAINRAPLEVTGQFGLTLARSATAYTDDLSLWQLIVNSTDRLSFGHYLRFMDALFCGEDDVVSKPPPDADRYGRAKVRFGELRHLRMLPFTDTDAYRVIKAATEAFVMVNCGTLANPPFHAHRDMAYFAKRDLPPPGHQESLAESFEHDYLVGLSDQGRDGEKLRTLPYLAVIRAKLPDVAIKFSSLHLAPEQVSACQGILQEKLTDPCLLELIWSYWHEEGMLVQTMNSIARRFQNVRGRDRDPLANLEIDPLRSLNSVLWGYVQDEQHRLSVARRSAEYAHLYGFELIGKAARRVPAGDSRSRFLEAFHSLLRLCTVFFRQDDDTTVKADAFPVLNALKEVHLILSQATSNQYGEMPSTARVEMLIQQWILARPEFREFLPTRIMTAYPEPWMDRVDAMKKLQGWTDTSVLHFRNLAMFGEQILLSVRWGHWSNVTEPLQAFNWARFFRPQIQGYCYAYSAATGVDLAGESFDARVGATPPSVLLKRRMSVQQRMV